jgi:hypothetical protein
LTGGSENGAFLSLWEFRYGNLEGVGSFAKGHEDYERKFLRTGISLYGGSVRQTGVDLSTGDFEIWLKGALELECTSLWELCEGNLEGGLSC